MCHQIYLPPPRSASKADRSARSISRKARLSSLAHPQPLVNRIGALYQQTDIRIGPDGLSRRALLPGRAFGVAAHLSICPFQLEDGNVVGPDDDRVSLIEGEVYRFELLLISIGNFSDNVLV